VPGHRTRLLNDIHALLAEQPARTALADVDETLTTGYAHALALEAQQLRLERRLLALAREGDSGGEAAELVGVLAGVERELHELRVLLVSLRDRARELRAAA